MRGILFRLFHRILICTVALDDIGLVVVLAVVIAGVAGCSQLRLVRCGIEQILIGAGRSVDAGRIFRDADTELDCIADDCAHFAQNIARLELCFLPACLEGTAVDNQVTVIDPEKVTGRVEINVVLVRIDHITGKGNLAGTGSLRPLVAPCRGVDDGQRRTVLNLKGVQIMR